MPAGYELLSVIRVNRAMAALRDVRDLPQNLTFLDRCPVVNALDGEILAKLYGNVIIADIISDDAKGVTYSYEKAQLETTKVPNIKIGRNLTQEQINQLQSIEATGVRGEEIFTQWRNRILDNLLLGIRQRMEHLIVAMHLDDFDYNHLGIIMSNVSWGMPSELKATPSTAWDNTSATPITDILTMRETARVRFGKTFNRIRMSTTAFRYAIRTTEFLNQAKLVAANVLLAGQNINENMTMQNQRMFEAIIGMTIELYDGRYWFQDTAGGTNSASFLPVTKVIIDSTENDNNESVQDFANAVVTESVVNSMMGGSLVGQFSGAEYGPVSYFTAPSDLNPPNITGWGVARGFPRKHDIAANAVLTVGSFTDLVSTYTPVF